MSPEYRVTARTLRKEGISDPVGQTIERHMPDIGFDNVADVRFGAIIRFTIEAETNKQAREQAVDVLNCNAFAQIYNPLLDQLSIDSVRKLRPKN